MSVALAMKELRERVLILRGVRTVHGIAREIQVHPTVLRRWLRGTGNTSEETIRRIEAWANAMDAQAKDTTL